MFGFFSKKEKIIKKCSMCGLYDPVKSDMGNEFCFLCLVNRAKIALNIEQNNFEQKQDVYHIPLKHDSKCIVYKNVCLHSLEFKDQCQFKNNCEFINSMVKNCSHDCKMKDNVAN